MKHPLTDGVGPGEWVDDSKERRLVSLAEKRLVEAVARIAELEAALRPFAKLADCWEPTAEEGEQDIYIRYPDGFSTRVRVAIFLAARAALSTKEDGT